MTGRSACHSGKSVKGLRLIVLRNSCVRIELVVVQFDLGTNSTNPASVRINDARTNRDASWESEFRSSLLAERAGELTSREILSVLKYVSKGSTSSWESGLLLH